MSTWAYYVVLASRDLTRLWPTTQRHVIIVTGICLPILLLMGLKEGHVADLRADLLASPTGRQVVFWSAQGGDLLDEQTLESLRTEIPGIELIIPESQRIVRLSKEPANPPAEPPAGAVQAAGAAAPATSPEIFATLYPTRPRDPILKQAGAEIGPASRDRIVLSRPAAERLEAAVGDRLRLVIERSSKNVRETASRTVTVHAILDTKDQKGAIAFAHVQFVENLEAYVRGYRVEQFGWPAIQAPVADKYAGYLVVCQRRGDLTAQDKRTLKDRGLVLQRATEGPERALYGLLRPGQQEDVRVYLLTSKSSRENPANRLALAPSELAEFLESDCVVMPWNPPVVLPGSDKRYRLIGISLPERIWLRNLLIDPTLGFGYESEAFVARRPQPGGEGKSQRLRIQVESSGKLGVRLLPGASDKPAPGEPQNAARAGSGGTGGTADVRPRAASGASAQEQRHAAYAAAAASGADPGQVAVAQDLIVPANLVAYLDAYHTDRAAFDPDIHAFVPLARPIVYDKARLYARTIDYVPHVVQRLVERGYAVMSEDSRIREIHQQSGSLQILVYVVGIGVFVFGVVTVFSVLLDSTERKRNAIGILRVMGVSQGGVFFLVVFRALVIGLLAGLLSVALGLGFGLLLSTPATSEWLSWKPVVNVVLSPRDTALVYAGAMVCAAVGAILPAWRASRLDPFEAVVEGHFD